MSDQIQRLREVAEAATEGPWEHQHDQYGDEWWFGGLGDGGQHTIRAGSRPHIVTDGKHGADAEHIATFDPPTVLELLDRLERAEAAVERVREVERRLFFMSSAEAHAISEDLEKALDGGER